MAVVYATRSDLDDFGGLPDGALSNEGRIASSSLAATDTFELDAHGFVTGEDLQVRAVEGGSLPAPLNSQTVYYAVRITDSTFKLSATAGGAAIDLTTNGTDVVISKPLPIDRHLELYSRWVDDFLPAHLVPLAPGPDGKYPIVVTRLVALLAGKSLLNRDGKTSDIVNATEIAAKAQLERWAKGIPLRDGIATASANLAVTTTLSSSGYDARGWGSGEASLMALTGDISSLARFSARLRDLPRTVAIKVAEAAAPALTAAARTTFEAGENAYGNTWEPRADGTRATLTRSGALARGITYVAIGTKIRVKLAVPYAKYMLGRRPVFPSQGSPLPPAYVAALKNAAESVIAAEMGSS